jgi:DNA-binding response OmpR family regulator
MSSIVKKLSSSMSRKEDITLLAVIADQDDQRSLQDMLSADRWTIRTARSCNEAMRVVESSRPTVIACERELPDGSWKDVFGGVSGLDDPPPVIVLSRSADEKFWAEVLNLGGYDVLAKPFDRTEVCRVLSMARRYGRQMTQALQLT